MNKTSWSPTDETQPSSGTSSAPPTPAPSSGSSKGWNLVFSGGVNLPTSRPPIGVAVEGTYTKHLNKNADSIPEVFSTGDRFVAYGVGGSLGLYAGVGLGLGYSWAPLDGPGIDVGVDFWLLSFTAGFPAGTSLRAPHWPTSISGTVGLGAGADIHVVETQTSSLEPLLQELWYPDQPDPRAPSGSTTLEMPLHVIVGDPNVIELDPQVIVSHWKRISLQEIVISNRIVSDPALPSPAPVAAKFGPNGYDAGSPPLAVSDTPRNNAEVSPVSAPEPVVLPAVDGGGPAYSPHGALEPTFGPHGYGPPPQVPGSANRPAIDPALGLLGLSGEFALTSGPGGTLETPRDGQRALNIGLGEEAANGNPGAAFATAGLAGFGAGAAEQIMNMAFGNPLPLGDPSLFLSGVLGIPSIGTGFASGGGGGDWDFSGLWNALGAVVGAIGGAAQTIGSALVNLLAPTPYQPAPGSTPSTNTSTEPDPVDRGNRQPDKPQLPWNVPDSGLVGGEWDPAFSSGVSVPGTDIDPDSNPFGMHAPLPGEPLNIPPPPQWYQGPGYQLDPEPNQVPLLLGYGPPVKLLPPDPWADGPDQLDPEPNQGPPLLDPYGPPIVFPDNPWDPDPSNGPVDDPDSGMPGWLLGSLLPAGDGQAYGGYSGYGGGGGDDRPPGPGGDDNHEDDGLIVPGPDAI